MANILKVLKINFLSLLALPFFLLTILAQLLMKAVQKTMVFIGLGAALFALFLLNLLFNNPGGFLDGLGTFFAILIVFGSIILIVAGILFLFGTVAAALVTAVISLLTTILDSAFHLCHNLYCQLFDICRRDHSALTADSASPALRLTCPFFYLMKGLNALIVFLLSIAGPLAICASIGIIGYLVYSVHRFTSQSFGLGIFAYLKLFPTVNVVFSVLYFVVVALGIATALVTLGMEWMEWGKLLKFSTQNYQEYRNTLLEQSMQMDAPLSPLAESGSTGDAAKCQEYMDSLQLLLNEAESLQQQVDAVMNIKPDPALAYDFAEYMSLLEKILADFSKYKKEIPCHDFETLFIPEIKKAQKLSHDLTQKVLSALSRQTKTRQNQTAPDFFAGCQTEEELKRRYRALSKIYHPDAGGHSESFTLMQDQYNRRTAELGGAADTE